MFCFKLPRNFHVLLMAQNTFAQHDLIPSQARKTLEFAEAWQLLPLMDHCRLLHSLFLKFLREKELTDGFKNPIRSIEYKYTDQ